MKRFIALVGLMALFIGSLDAAERRVVRKQTIDNKSNYRNTQKSNQASQNYSGGFIGINGGYAGQSAEFNIIGTGGKAGGAFGLKGGGFDIGLLGGYKWVWNYIGVRVYGNIDYIGTNLKVTKNTNPEMFNKAAAYTFPANYLNYGLNADFLVKFYNSPSFDIGAFIGLGLGGDTFFLDETWNKMRTAFNTMQGGSFGNDIYNLLKPNQQSTHFSTWANIGLNMHIMRNHGLEITAKVPFMKQKLSAASMDGGGVQGFDGLELNTATNFIIKVGYIYNF